ncbi:MAG: hypothetical protein A2297_01880 [Elusimicrobia bacterium RIFOXYB2_FULL_48_7]|nr:MAG: hypothetical protein A2297_01880 [Elusimicrobia bacterium RIFOXYB2_FULL_48_7]
MEEHKSENNKIKGMQVLDFCIGLFSTIILVFIILKVEATSLVSVWITVISVPFILAILIHQGLIKKKKYVLVGIVSTVLLPLLFMGSCFIVYVVSRGIK